MNVDQLFIQFKSGFPRRKFSAGLLMAFIDFFRELGVPDMGLRHLDDFFEAFPRRNLTQQGVRANTLIVQHSDGTLSIRKFYDLVETEIRAGYHRFDYPNCAAHATQAWEQHIDWLVVLVTLSDNELVELRQRVLNFVLETLPDQTFDPTRVRREAPLFRYILDGFDITARKGEKAGAAYQGIAFGFLRADNPHLQVEIHKVGAGSARRRGIGDIDCWDGGSLAISAEVKQYAVRNTTQFVAFANEINRRGALGMVVALDFESKDVRQEIEALGPRSLTLDDLLGIVELWDPTKQRIAVNSFIYYVEHIEQSSALSKRLHDYLLLQAP